jgi:hypothetical protein
LRDRKYAAGEVNPQQNRTFQQRKDTEKAGVVQGEFRCLIFVDELLKIF